eukprot:TRINITY_DN96789_c0_g1_i1.p2 TRINITY_DN96789_c0_g1~~TRINITY_DN96789_c0_g1_i1.p2  ORF type:complete len:100 (+),score=15.95 TRINITY_DN96789_c0_g1_i1:16-315(+)
MADLYALCGFTPPLPQGTHPSHHTATLPLVAPQRQTFEYAALYSAFEQYAEETRKSLEQIRQEQSRQTAKIEEILQYLRDGLVERPTQTLPDDWWADSQ